MAQPPASPTTTNARLRGVRVVTMALNTPGPIAAARLAAEGAAVTKIEPPAGDPLAAICPAWYQELHEHVTVRRIDLKSADGRTGFWSLVDTADVLLSSQRPLGLARLGIDPVSLARVRWVNIVGERAQPNVPGHDLTYQARAGLLRDALPASLFADVMGAERAVSEVLLVLRQPPGTHAMVGLYDSLTPFAATVRHGLTVEGGLLGGGLPAYGVYRAKAGSIAIAALEPHFRKRLYELLQLAPDSPLDDAMRTRTADEWERWGEAHDLPLARVR